MTETTNNDSVEIKTPFFSSQSDSNVWRANNKERSNQRKRDWYHRNRDKLLVKTTAYRNTHKQYFADHQREYRKRRGSAYFKKLHTDYYYKYPERRMVVAARAVAKKKKLPFNLVYTDIAIPSHCPVLGIELINRKGPRSDYSPSLDRIIPALGYVKGNVMVISWRANRIKQDSTSDELRKIADFYQRLGRQ